VIAKISLGKIHTQHPFQKEYTMPKINTKNSNKNITEPHLRVSNDGDEIPPLSDAMMKLIDDFADYCDISAFICHALAISLSEQEQPNMKIIAGARICSAWLQTRSAEVQGNLSDVHARYVSEHNKGVTA